MAVATRICKVCGKEYEYCRTKRNSSDIFRWQDVACCPEHGSIYFERIAASRAPQKDLDKDTARAEETSNEDKHVKRKDTPVSKEVKPAKPKAKANERKEPVKK